MTARCLLVSVIVFFAAPLWAQAPATQVQVKPKIGGATDAAAVKPSGQTAIFGGGNPAADLGYAAAIPQDEKILRLQKRVAELMHQIQALQKQYDSLNASLGTLAKATVTFRCDASGGEPRSFNSLGASVACSPYACNATTGQCYRPFCAGTDQCSRGFVCDVGASNLCVSASP